MAPLHRKRMAMTSLLPESAHCAIFLAQERSRQISTSFQACGFIPRPRALQTSGVGVVKRRTISMWSMHASNEPIPHEDVMERTKTSLGGGSTRTTSQEPTDGRQSQGQGSDGAREKPPATAYHDPPRQAAKHHPIVRIGIHSRDTDEGPWPGRIGSDRGKQLAGTKAATAAKQLAGMKA